MSDKIGTNNVFHAVQSGGYDSHVHHKMFLIQISHSSLCDCVLSYQCIVSFEHVLQMTSSLFFLSSLAWLSHRATLFYILYHAI